MPINDVSIPIIDDNKPYMFFDHGTYGAISEKVSFLFLCGVALEFPVDRRRLVSTFNLICWEVALRKENHGIPQ